MTEIQEYEHEIPRMGAKVSRGTMKVPNQRLEMSGPWPEDRIVGAVRRFVTKCMDTEMSVDDISFRDSDYTADRVPKYPEQMMEVQEWASDIMTLLEKRTKLSAKEKSNVSDINSILSEDGAGCSILLAGDPNSFKEVFKDVPSAIFTDAGNGLTRVDIEDGMFLLNDDGSVCFYSASNDDVEIKLSNNSIVRAQSYKGEFWQNSDDYCWDGTKRVNPEASRSRGRLVTRGAMITTLKRCIKRLESKKMPAASRSALERKVAAIKRRLGITEL